MKKLLPLLLLPALVSCGGEETHDDRQAKLLKYRGVNEVCMTYSRDCRSWTRKALQCEENLAKVVPGTACIEMEEFREQVTGIAVSSDPGAYSF